MRIGASPRLLMRHAFSGKRMCNLPLPSDTDWSFNPKAAPKMSEEKYKEAIVAQAKKDAPTGKFGVECPGFRSLMESYVSAVSPDRKSIIETSLSKLDKSSQLPEAEATSLLDILFGERILPGGTSKKKISYAEFKDSNGQIVATYSEMNGWSAVSTKAEDARNSEFYDIYRDAWNAARGLKDSPAPKAAANAFDVTA